MAALVVALTGSDSAFGRALVEACEADPQVAQVIALDGKPRADGGPKTTYRELDLVHPASVEPLSDALVRADVVVHTAFLARPQFRGGWAHELETTGTRHLLLATEAANVGAFVMRSTTLVYGAQASHPARIPESASLDGRLAGSFLRDKVEAELQVQRFAERHPDRTVTLLRFAPLLGIGAETIGTAYLGQRLCPTLLGFDPVTQFIHLEDAVEATRLAIHRHVAGAVNVAAPGVLALSDAIRLSGATRLPLPEAAVRRTMGLLWTLEVGALPPGLVSFLRYPVVGDLTAMTERLGFTPRFAVRDAVLAFAGARRLAASVTR